jgi:hypothetical protein
MKLTRTRALAAARTFLVLTGFVTGLGTGLGEANPPRLLEAVVSAVLGVLLIPLLVVFFFRIEVAMGLFKPPWEHPSSASTMNPLSLVQLGYFVFAALGLGAAMAIPWRGLPAFSYALLALSGAIGLDLALVQLLRSFPPPQMNNRNQDSRCR